MTFAQVLNELMNSRGVTNYALAKYLKCSQSTIKNWLTNTTRPNHDKLKQVAEYFGVSVDYILGTTDEKEKPSGNTTEGPITPKDQIINEIVKNLKSSSLDEVKRFDRMLDAFLADRRK